VQRVNVPDIFSIFICYIITIIIISRFPDISLSQTIFANMLRALDLHLTRP